MGMFDYVTCEQRLPDGWESHDLQTKDLDCEMVRHVITKEGRLLVDKGFNETVPVEERPYGHLSEDDMRHWYSSIRRVSKMEDSNYHGYLHLHGTELIGRQEDGRPIYKFHSYRAKFTDGQLINIEMCDD